MDFKHPSRDDAGEMWRIAKETSLDLNSSYSYLMMAELFPETCLVVEDCGEIVAFTTGFEFKKSPDTLFIWQIAVKPEYRKHKLAQKMLYHLVEDTGAHYVQATIEQANKASFGLFESVAEKFNTKFWKSDGFEEDHFPDDHDSETMIKVGPINKENFSNT
jgi:L-2,4-diaminobutyric acid acetyltransferase